MRREDILPNKVIWRAISVGEISLKPGKKMKKRKRHYQRKIKGNQIKIQIEFKKALHTQVFPINH